MRRSVATALCALVASFAVPAAAFADNGPPPPPYGNQDNFGWTNGQGVGASASTPGAAGDAAPVVAGTGGSDSAPVCTYTPLSSQESASANDMAVQGWGPAKGAGAGAWYRQVCVVDAQGNTNGTVIWLAQPPAPAVNPLVLAQQALGYTPFGSPAIRLDPPANRDQLVGVKTWLWLAGGSWSPVSANASAGGVTVTTTAIPQQVTWTMGDGNTVTCGGPGTPYDPSHPDAQPTCSYTYAKSSAGQPGGAFTITATESWQVAWAAAGAPAGVPAGGNLGPVTRTAQLPVHVAESQAINTGG